MPIVTVQMYPGRSNTVKEFLARSLVDSVSEIAGTSREAVHVIFDEVSKSNWAIGPRLVENRTIEPENDYAPSFLAIGRVKVKEGKLEQYLAWRRDSVFPFMASHEGFISSLLLADPNDSSQYIVVNKWTSAEAQEAYTAKPREAELRVEAREMLDQLVTEEMDGQVVDVFHGRSTRA